MNHLLVILAIIFFTAHYTYGQQIQPAALSGRWQGTVTSKVKEFRAQGTISIFFRDQQKVSISTPEQDEGTFAIEGDSIIITLQDTPSEPIKLKHVSIQGNTLRAELVLVSDAPGISNVVELSKLAAQSKTMLAPSGSPNICADLNLPESIQTLFEKYEIGCPINLPKNASYYELAFYRRLLSDVVRELIGKTYDIAYTEGKLHVLVPNYERAMELRNIIAPLLQDANLLAISIVGMPRCPPPFQCGLEFLGVRELKPEYRSNDRIDFNQVWSKVIQVAEAKNVRFVGTSRDGNSWSAQTSEPSLVAQNPNGFFYEKLSIQMTDEYANDSAQRGTYLRLFIKSEIWQKKAASVKRALKIEDQCSVGTSNLLGFTCSDKSIMNDIIQSITIVVRGI